jgi:hypothetical protein
MGSGTDSAGHRYVEFDKSDNEQIRVTYIPHQSWADVVDDPGVDGAPPDLDPE